MAVNEKSADEQTKIIIENILSHSAKKTKKRIVQPQE